MSSARCPACRAETKLDAAARACPSCGAPLLLGGRYALTGEPPAEAGTDVVDGAAPIWEGIEANSQTRVLIRLAPAESSARLEREAVVLRGLNHPKVPRV